MPRGAAFIYDQQTGNLENVIYDGHIGELTAKESALLTTLKPMDALQGRLHPNAKKAPRLPRVAGRLQPSTKPKRSTKPKKRPKRKR